MYFRPLDQHSAAVATAAAVAAMSAYISIVGDSEFLPNGTVWHRPLDQDPAAAATNAATAAKAAGISVITVGVGGDINSPLLRSMSSGGNSFTVADFGGLAGLASAIPGFSAGDCGTPAPTGAVSRSACQHTCN